MRVYVLCHWKHIQWDLVRNRILKYTFMGLQNSQFNKCNKYFVNVHYIFVHRNVEYQ